MSSAVPPRWWQGSWWYLSEDGQSWGTYCWVAELFPVQVLRPRPVSQRGYEYAGGWVTEWRYFWVWRWSPYEDIQARERAVLSRYRADVLEGRREPVSSSSSDAEEAF